MATDIMPRTPGTPRQAPGRPVPPGRAVPPGRPVPPGGAVSPGRAVLPGRGAPPQGTGPKGRARPGPDSPGPDRATPRPPARNRTGSDLKNPPDPKTPKSPKKPKKLRNPRNPKNPRTRLFTAPRHTRPITGSVAAPVAKPVTRTTTRPVASQGTRPRHPRAPFILLLVGLLGGALVSLLVISTTLAEGSFTITGLQQQDTNLARQEQVLTEQVAQASSPARIAQEAEQFGMQQDPNLRFINLKTGKMVSGRVSKADAEIDVSGYTP